MDRGRHRHGGRGRGEGGRRGSRDFEGRGRGGGRFEGGRGRGGGRGGGTPESRQHGEDATRRALQGLTLFHTDAKRLTPETMRLAKRPDKGGRAGKVVGVYANFFAMKVAVERVFHYDLDIKSKEERILGEGDEAAEGQMLLPLKLCRAIVNACADQHRWPVGWVYDGKKNIYCPHDRFQKQTWTFDVVLEGDGRSKTFQVRLKWASTISLLDIGRYLQRGDIPIPREALQSLEVCLRFSASNRPGSQFFGRSVYFDDEPSKKSIEGGAELWLGHHQGVKLCQEGLAVNLETTYGAFTKRRPILELFEEALGRRIPQLRGMDQGKYNRMKRTVAGVLVQATHRRNHVKKLRCRGLTKKAASDEKFTLKDGTEKTVAQYWTETYGRLEFPWLPCLDVSKGKKISYLPAEVCEVCPGQRIQKLSENQTRDMIRFSAQDPASRKNSIVNALRTLDPEKDPAAHAFGVQLGREMLQCRARILPQPHLQYAHPESMDTGDRGAWNLERVKFLRPGSIRSWSIASMIPSDKALQGGPTGLQGFMQELINMLQSMGMTVPNLPPLIHAGNRLMDDVLQEAAQKAQTHYGSPPDIVLVILERKEIGPYAEVKKIAERDLGVVTQCIVARSAGIGCPPKGRPQYLANVGMKINHKVGGVNTQIMTSISSLFPPAGPQKKPFIVFGADVTHPTGFDTSEPSVGALVASMDQYLGQYAARVVTMPAREDRMSLQPSVMDLLKQFRLKNNNAIPESIVLFRGGISEGQFQNILEHEYRELRKACQALNPSYSPAITMVAVQKMHHTRFFPATQSDGDHKGNIKPGTCVDAQITSRYEFDYYLNSHAGIQGTNKPAHYCVLVDENGFGSDGLQLFTYWMCYLYCRCTRSVSYCPPAYYAHLAALHGRYLVTHRSDSSSENSDDNNGSLFHADLSQRMFFV